MLETFLLILTVETAAAAPSPDLRLEWVGGVAPLSVKAGDAIVVGYVLRNTGGSDAFAVVVRAVTSLGPLGEPVRVHPGPKARQSMERRLTFTAAEGLREVCIDATLQNLNRDDPADPTPSNNRICRSIQVSRPKESDAP